MMEARLRVRAYLKGNTLADNKVYESYYGPDGNFIAAVVWQNNKYYILRDEPMNTRTMRTTQECTVESYTSDLFYCQGTNPNDLICYYIKKTTRKYRCDYNPTGEEEPVSWIENEGGGWWEYEESSNKYQNQEVIDSLQGFPCAQEILKQLPEINTFTDSLLNGVFGVTEKVKLTFRAANMPQNYNGANNFDGVIDGEYHFTIYLNSWMLTHSSIEYILKSMLHESIHSMIDFEYQKYIDHLIDSTQFKSLYPLVWEYKRDNQAYARHLQMAKNYVDAMADVLQWYHFGLSEWKATSIAWDGLQSTSAYSNSTDQDMRSFAYMARNGSPADFFDNGLESCPW